MVHEDARADRRATSLTEQQPLNNIVRVAYQAMAAVLGGCRSPCTELDGWEPSASQPSRPSPSRLHAQILAYETGITRTTVVFVPSAARGSSRKPPDKVEAGALGLIDEIDRMGMYKSSSHIPTSHPHPHPLTGLTPPTPTLAGHSGRSVVAYQQETTSADRSPRPPTASVRSARPTTASSTACRLRLHRGSDERPSTSCRSPTWSIRPVKKLNLEI